MEHRPVPEIGPDDVLIRIRKTGICGTDVHIWNWDDWAQRTVPVGLITGHEFAGEIVEIGRNVDDLKVGQRCSGEGHLIGRHSRQSRSGRFHLDPETRGVGVRAATSRRRGVCVGKGVHARARARERARVAHVLRLHRVWLGVVVRGRGAHLAWPCSSRSVDLRWVRVAKCA
jgi:threonine dehydrogenase-like Zn-dependent dehydrogenase